MTRIIYRIAQRLGIRRGLLRKFELCQDHTMPLLNQDTCTIIWLRSHLPSATFILHWSLWLWSGKTVISEVPMLLHRIPDLQKNHTRYGSFCDHARSDIILSPSEPGFLVFPRIPKSGESHEIYVCKLPATYNRYVTKSWE